MSHFYIVQLSAEPVGKENRINAHHLENDPAYEARADYGGDPVSDEEEVLEEIKRELKDIAFVSVEKRAVTFINPDRLREAYARDIKKAFDEHMTKLKEEKRCEWWRFHRRIENVFGIDDLFFTNGYCQRAGELVEDLINGNMPLELHIGAILWAHR